MRNKKASPGRGTPVRHQQRDYTDRELAEQIHARFRGRDDVFAVSTTNGMAPEWMPITVERLASEHLGGRRCLALYVLREDNHVEVSCLDFDNKVDRPDPTIESSVKAVVQCLRKLGLHPLVERSQSGRGVHVWLFFGKPRPAWLVRAFWRGVLQHLNLPLGTEIFPRQDERNVSSGKGLGNPIRFPLWGRSEFVAVTPGWPRLDPMAALSAIKPVTLRKLKQVATALGFKLDKPQKSVTPLNGKVLPGSLSPRVMQLLASKHDVLSSRWNGDTTGLNDTSRSSIASSIAALLVHRYVPTDEIEAAIKRWCELNAYEKGARQDWVDIVVRHAYEFAWRSDDLRRRGFIARPSSSLPSSLRREYGRSVAARIKTKNRSQEHGRA